jgi:hypothetical protein
VTVFGLARRAFRIPSQANDNIPTLTSFVSQKFTLTPFPTGVMKLALFSVHKKGALYRNSAIPNLTERPPGGARSAESRFSHAKFHEDRFDSKKAPGLESSANWRFLEVSMRRFSIASANLISPIALFDIALCPDVSAQFNPIRSTKNAHDGTKQQQQQKNAPATKGPRLVKNLRRQTHRLAKARRTAI